MQLTKSNAPATVPLSPYEGATPARPCRLLQLPDDLLARIGHLGGKECRVLCSRLRDAYGPPAALAVQPPLTGFEAELNIDPVDNVYNTPLEEFHFTILSKLYAWHGSKFAPDAIASCGARWPAWAAQVTRLELSDAYSPDAAALRTLQQALPGLQQLQLAVRPFWDPYKRPPHTGPDYYAGVPQFPHVTQLVLQCSSYALLPGWRARHPAHFELLLLTLSLRSLHLDLRFLFLEHSNLRHVLEQLQQLTHLELVYGPEGPDFDDGYTQAISTALLSLEARLQSLVFLAPPFALGDGIADVLHRMTRLTRLGWASGYDFVAEAVEPTHDCLLAPSVQQLVLGSSKPGQYTMAADTMELVALGIASSAAARPALRSLSLPLVVQSGLAADGAEEGQQALSHVLRAVAARCTGLAGLRVGWDWQYWPGGPMPNAAVSVADHWLQNAVQFQQLRQLVVAMHGCELDALGCLAGLPLLAELWLTVQGDDMEARLQQQEQQYQPGSGLAQLGSLTQLAIRTGADSSILAHSMLATAAALPRLQVLDVTAAKAFAIYVAAWEPLAASPPRGLREVRLEQVPSWRPPVDHVRTLALLRQRLPPDVALSVSEYNEDSAVWGPLPECLHDVTIKWSREYMKRWYSAYFKYDLDL